MRFAKILAISAVLLIAVRMLAQFSVVNQPIFANAPVASQNFATNLAHRWVATDLATNTSFTTWTDKITGVHQWLVAGGGTMSNTPLGVRFTSAGASMTNRWGATSNLFSILNAAGNDTNYAMGIIFKVDSTGIEDFNFRVITANNGDGNPRWIFSLGTADTALQMFVSANNFMWVPWPKATPSTNWYAMAWGATNNNTGHPYHVTWMNGLYATNFGPDTGNGAIGQLGMRNANPATMTFNFRGWIREFWVRTNALVGDGFDGFAKDLNYVRTNIYASTNLVE